MKPGAQQFYDVAVIGAGLAGMAASLFAAERGLRCALLGRSGSILFASGLLDLFGVDPAAAHRTCAAPAEALRELQRRQAEHPLARIAVPALFDAFAAFTRALGEAGLRYTPATRHNHVLVTSLGTAKTTYAIPNSMRAGVEAYAAKDPCLIVDFRGLREFSAKLIAEALLGAWPGLRAQRVDFPGLASCAELYPVHLARALESGDVRRQLIASLQPALGEAQAVGFPALLGMDRHAQVHAALEAGLERPVFEIPMMPPSVPGFRLAQALETALARRGVTRYGHSRVVAIAFDRSGTEAQLTLDGTEPRPALRARSVILATGRFLGQGLNADRRRVRECLLDLPVHQPRSRAEWHAADFFDARGHAINRAGVRVDHAWRPLIAASAPAWPQLYAVGSILAHQDWMREKCGSGLSIGTAWAAVEQIAAARAARTNA